MRKNLILISISVAIIAGGAGFLGGTKYQKSKSVFPGMVNGARGQFVQRGNTNGGAGVVRGTIISKDEKSITVKMQDESSKIILLSDSTKVSKSVEASNDDLKEGESVTVFGQTNSDGSITAQNIQTGAEMPRP